MLKKQMLAWTSALILSAVPSFAVAETAMTPKAQFAADSKRAMTRYTSDNALCAEEKSSSARLQCRRDAKAEYDQSIAVAKKKMTVQTSVKSAAIAAAPVPATKVAAPAPVSKPLCDDCAKVLAVNVLDKEGEGGALGIIAGGAAGALLGNQVGGGTGKDIATVVGAVGGAYAGKTIEGQMKSRKVWSVTVQNPFGIKKNFRFDHSPGMSRRRYGQVFRRHHSSAVKNAGLNAGC
jgi:uncharacterized protein YcfJ